MKILITGATGFIGRALVEHLAASKHKLTLLVRSPTKAKHFPAGNSVLISELDELTDTPDAIINLAGEPIAQRWTSKTKRKICESRWQLTKQLVELIVSSHQPPKVFLSGSAIGYYGTDPKLSFNEHSQAVQHDFPHQVCAKWEDIAMQAHSSRTRICLLRTGLVVGAQGGMLKKMLPAFRLGLGGKVASGQQWMSWIHIKDQVKAIEFLLEKTECQGSYNLCSPNPVSNQQFSQQLAATLKRPCLISPPTILLSLGLGEMAMLLTQGQKVLPQRLQDAGFNFTYPELSKAFDDCLTKKNS